jgi:hypothetical protein
MAGLFFTFVMAVVLVNMMSGYSESMFNSNN